MVVVFWCSLWKCAKCAACNVACSSPNRSRVFVPSCRGAFWATRGARRLTPSASATPTARPRWEADFTRGHTTVTTHTVATTDNATSSAIQTRLSGTFTTCPELPRVNIKPGLFCIGGKCESGKAICKSRPWISDCPGSGRPAVADAIRVGAGPRATGQRKNSKRVGRRVWSPKRSSPRRWSTQHSTA